MSDRRRNGVSIAINAGGAILAILVWTDQPIFNSLYEYAAALLGLTGIRNDWFSVMVSILAVPLFPLHIWGQRGE